MDFDFTIITRYLSEEATEEEQKLLLDWLENNSHNRMIFSEYKKIWLEAKDELSSPFKKPIDAFELFNKREEDKKIHALRKPASVNSWLRYAAIIIIILSFGTLTFLIGLNIEMPNNEETASSEIIVPYGGISTVVLPDNTKVNLHSGSKLKYQKDFGKKNRIIELEGEAYFDVSENKETPFIVKTSHIDILVTGTRFNVKSYPDDNRIETALEVGSINIIGLKGKKINQPIILKPREKFTFYKEDYTKLQESYCDTDVLNQLKIPDNNTANKKSLNYQNIITKNIRIEEEIAWKDGNYILTNKSLPEIVKVLERRYNITIHYNHASLKDYTYSGVLKDLTLEQVLDALKLTSKLDYTIEERDVTLFRRTN